MCSLMRNHIGFLTLHASYIRPFPGISEYIVSHLCENAYFFVPIGV